MARAAGVKTDGSDRMPGQAAWAAASQPRPGAGLDPAAALEIAGLGMFDLDLAAEWMSWSDRASEIYGDSSARLGQWDAWLEHVHPEDRLKVTALRTAAQAEHELSEIEARFRFLRPDGDERWVVTKARVVRDAEGVAIRIAGVVTDATPDRQRVDQSARQLADLQHRVKNILAVVRSLCRGTLESADTLDAFVSHFDGRLSALARVQGVLARRGGVDVDLEELVREEFLQHAADADQRVTIEGPPLALDGKTAEFLGLALHELAANAVKFGALAARNGKVNVSWTLHDSKPGKGFLLAWVETGVPVIETDTAREGFGRRLIEQGLPYQLGAEAEFNLKPGGLRCAMRIPLSKGVGP
jgi:two-component system CheB/CheR fusion protein